MSLKKILLIDDNESEQFLYKSIIELYDTDIEVVSAYDGVEALEMLKQLEGSQNPPDCILLDINMPRMGGIEFLEEYKMQFPGNTIVIAMLTSSSHSKDKDKALEFDCVKGYFTKPLSNDDLKDLEGLIK